MDEHSRILSRENIFQINVILQIFLEKKYISSWMSIRESNKSNFTNPLTRKYISSWLPKGHPKGVSITIFNFYKGKSKDGIESNKCNFSNPLASIFYASSK